MAQSANHTPFIIAIDGPAGSGKTTTAKALSELLDFVYIDTGAMYRAVAYAVTKRGIALDDAKAVCTLLPELVIRIEREEGRQITVLNGENVEPFIRTPEMSMAASAVSAIPCVREAMVHLQREAGAQSKGAVLEGRDIGTVVFPDSPCKVYLVADVVTRARRRVAQLAEQGIEADFEQLQKEIAERDRADSTRDHSPLMKAQDAIEVETTNTSIDEQVTMIFCLVEKRLNKFGKEHSTI